MSDWKKTEREIVKDFTVESYYVVLVRADKIEEEVEIIKDNIHADPTDVDTARNIIPRLNRMILNLGLLFCAGIWTGYRCKELELKQ